jgi:hypothetical protein
MAVMPYQHGNHWRLGVGNTTPTDGHEIRFAINIGPYQKSRPGIHQPIGGHLDLGHSYPPWAAVLSVSLLQKVGLK